MQEGFLKERGIAYRSNTVEPGRKTLLFVHGLSGTLSAWDDYAEELEDTYNVITVDLRGHGNSVRPYKFADYALPRFAEDIDALLRQLGVETCHIISHSFGALVVLEFLHRYPQRASGALFLAAPYRMNETWLRRTRLLTHAARTLLDLSPLPLGGKGRLDYRGFGWSPDWSLRRIAPEIYRMGLRSYLRCLVSIYDSGGENYWGELQLPLLFIHGTDDSFIPFSQAQRLSETLPHARLLAIQGGNHMLVLNNKKEILEAVREFVR